MRTQLKKISKSPWTKLVVRKWLNTKGNDDKLHSKSDYYITERWWMESSNRLKYSVPGKEALPISDTLDLRMFVGTWNVGGKSPDENLDLRDWLKLSSRAEIFVIGFQEIIALNAGDVLGPEDNGPASKWLNLIHKALNPKDDIIIEEQVRHQEERSINCKARMSSVSKWLCLEEELLESEEFGDMINNKVHRSGGDDEKKQGYCLVGSKQMVGIYLCVWVREDLCKHVSNFKVSCVGRGIMGYLGNKGSISISMTLYQTSFCFVCTHLASGEKDGDEVRRNLDVSEILKKTKFSHSFKPLSHHHDNPLLSPETILKHNKIIWLGDLNYRLASGYDDTHELLKKNDWHSLLERDQLRIEQRGGRVFKEWKEGKIYFAPTYKYLDNSDQYVAQTSKSKENRRTPAWCDRILWKGEGIEQLWYVRGESKFSDHRPVYSLFSVQVDYLKCEKLITTTTTSSSFATTTTSEISRSSCLSRSTITNAALSSSSSSSSSSAAKIQAGEQLLLLTRAHQSCVDVGFG
ncbi:hypothetical protein HN51_021974 [Arachis hypogaea]|uniref:type I inositol polyphosphate 5-phosphatase 8 n=1 Tax=Arachis hypogaea TaxID=3818 RepID=UPI000DEC407E|nr:Type I inositol polyphosphate 5-phosphatase [Arachis hypogaea]QHO53079.1 Type I inositol polyphosphate 5-phosphatase [Arachis hypogaea]